MAKPEIITKIENLQSSVQSHTTQLAEKAKQVDLNNTNTRVTNVENNKRDKSEAIKGTELDISSDSNKVKLINLSDEVKQAMAGTTPINASVSNESLVEEKYADKSIKGYKTDFLTQNINLFNKDDIILGKYYDTAGNLQTNATFNSTNFIKVIEGSIYHTNISYKGNITFWTKDKTFISSISAGWTSPITVPANAVYLVMTLYAPNDISTVMLCKDSLPQSFIPFGYSIKDFVDLPAKIKSDLDAKYDFTVNLNNKIIKKAISKNLFNKLSVINGSQVYSDGRILSDATGIITEYINVEGLSNLYVSGLTPYTSSVSNRYGYFYDATKTKLGSAITISVTDTEASIQVPSGAVYFAMSICQLRTGSETINLNIIQIESGVLKTTYTSYEDGIYKLNGSKLYTSGNFANTLKTEGKNFLIFGDSITATATVSDDGATYTEGTTTNWATYSKIALKMGQMWNYAMSGAAYRDRDGVLVRQKISHQITTAIANNRPADIIVISCGTNDANINLGDYATAMSKATLNDLDRTKLYEAIRWAFWTLRQNYPNAICFVATPIQRADREPLTDLSNAIKQMANRYNFIVIDAEYESGIVRDFEVPSGAGRHLIDGLHPNANTKISMSKLYNRVILNALNDGN